MSALMVLGTASHTGKSMLTAGLCRIFADEGLRVAPFKAQNMSLNSAATPDGFEIGRAQALQAEACRIPASADMNPVLIKPSSDTGSQIILNGKVWANVTAADYFNHRVTKLFFSVVESFQRLAEQHDLVILEGAGSPAEINLRDYDIVNMRMARAANAECILVGDIDRGGVFASLLGTIELLTPEDRERIRGFVINKFRGDVSLLEPGVRMIEQRLNIPCVGVVPYLKDLGLDEEDSVSLPDFASTFSPDPNKLRIGVIPLPHISNFTDFHVFSQEPSVSLAFLSNAEQLQQAHIVLIPGTKQTIDDLAWLRKQRYAEAIIKSANVVGICGGFQMLGLSIDDPLGVENDGAPRTVEALGLLDIHTTLTATKTVRRARSERVSGYEIHMGETRYAPNARPFATIVRENDTTPIYDGAKNETGNVWGTYLHGVFDDDAFRHSYIERMREKAGLPPSCDYVNVTAQRQARLDRWANHLRQALNLNLIRGWLNLP